MEKKLGTALGMLGMLNVVPPFSLLAELAARAEAVTGTGGMPLRHPSRTTTSTVSGSP